jgi:hypothetical protein
MYTYPCVFIVHYVHMSIFHNTEFACSFPFCPSVFLATLLRLFKWEFPDSSFGQDEEDWWLSSGYSHGCKAGDMRPTGSFLVGETLQTLVSGTSERMGLLATRLGKAVFDLACIHGHFPWLSREVFYLQFGLANELCSLLPNSWGGRRTWRSNILLLAHFHRVGGIPFTSLYTWLLTFTVHGCRLNRDKIKLKESIFLWQFTYGWGEGCSRKF